MLNRYNLAARDNWQQKVNDVGMFYHTIDNKIYWNESACYSLDSKLVDKIEDATNLLHEMCIMYVMDTIQTGNYDPAYNFDDYTISLIEQSWKNLHPYIYGRFDLGIDRNGTIKLFEYNADTPTSLLEAAVVQWNWKEEIFSDKDQFNSIHEQLIERWKTISPSRIHFAAMQESPMEDWGNVHYLLETANSVGHLTSSIDIEAIGWDSENCDFVDLNNENIDYLFKLYPWEWFTKDEFYKNIKLSKTQFIEPPWKMLLSNKLLCVKLWEKHPNHEFLLESHLGERSTSINFNNKKKIAKPLLGREGQLVTEFKDKYPIMENQYIVQEKFDVIQFNGIHPVIGSWVIGDIACGIGIREDYGMTTNNSCFVPHIFS